MKQENIFIGIAFLVGLGLGFLFFQSNSINVNQLGKQNNSALSKVEYQKIINNNLMNSGPKLTVAKTENKGDDLVKITLDYKGQKQVLFANNKGTRFYPEVFDLVEIEKQKKAAEDAKKINSKNDKPKVELFVMSYCPYGTQTEKGYLPAVQKLGDKIDAKIKFVNYVMHPSKGEGEENLLQYCIQEKQPEKFNSYLGCFLKEGKTEECLVKNNIIKKELKDCLSTTDKKFKVADNLKDKTKWLNGRYPKFNIQDDLNKKYGVQGSPTLVINGQKVEGVGRDADSIFKAICSAFKTPPEVCKEELDKTTPAPGFGYDNKGGANSEGGCGA